MTLDLNLLQEVENVLERGTTGRRNELLQHVTNLFVLGADRFEGREIAQFDDLIIRLAVDIEMSARALLAIRLAPIPNAPPKIIRKLACDDAIDVAGPVLTQSERLDDLILVENAQNKSQKHLLAISRRQSLSEDVTDVLLERGDRQVLLSTVGNRGARLSEAGFERLVQRSAGDDELTECAGARPEIPPRLFLTLLATASEKVRIKLEALHPDTKGEVRRAVAEVADRIRTETFEQSPDHRAALAVVNRLHQAGQLDDEKLGEFAKARKFVETTAALARMSDLPLQFVERAMLQRYSETVLVIAKVVGLSWPTVKAILRVRAGKRVVSADEFAQCRTQFERLKSATANEIVRFYRMREKPADGKSM